MVAYVPEQFAWNLSNNWGHNTMLLYYILVLIWFTEQLET